LKHPHYILGVLANITWRLLPHEHSVVVDAEQELEVGIMLGQGPRSSVSGKVEMGASSFGS